MKRADLLKEYFYYFVNKVLSDNRLHHPEKSPMLSGTRNNICTQFIVSLDIWHKRFHKRDRFDVELFSMYRISTAKADQYDNTVDCSNYHEAFRIDLSALLLE